MITWRAETLVGKPKMQKTISQGRLFLVLKAPLLISPLCCLIRRRGFTVNLNNPTNSTDKRAWTIRQSHGSKSIMNLIKSKRFSRSKGKKDQETLTENNHYYKLTIKSVQLELGFNNILIDLSTENWEIWWIKNWKIRNKERTRYRYGLWSEGRGKSRDSKRKTLFLLC